MQPDALRAALARTLREFGIPLDDGGEMVDELAAIADHHAAEEVAAGHD